VLGRSEIQGERREASKLLTRSNGTGGGGIKRLDRRLLPLQLALAPQALLTGAMPEPAAPILLPLPLLPPPLLLLTPPPPSPPLLHPPLLLLAAVVLAGARQPGKLPALTPCAGDAQ